MVYITVKHVPLTGQAPMSIRKCQIAIDSENMCSSTSSQIRNDHDASMRRGRLECAIPRLLHPTGSARAQQQLCSSEAVVHTPLRCCQWACAAGMGSLTPSMDISWPHWMGWSGRGGGGGEGVGHTHVATAGATGHALLCLVNAHANMTEGRVKTGGGVHARQGAGII